MAVILESSFSKVTVYSNSSVRGMHQVKIKAHSGGFVVNEDALLVLCSLYGPIEDVRLARLKVTKLVYAG